MADAADLVHCSLCRFPTRTISEWISHLRLVHSKDDDFLLRCGINGCPNEYRKCSSFISHVYRRHRDLVITCSKERVSASAEEGISSENCSSLVPLHESISETFEPVQSQLNHTIHHLLGIEKTEQKKKSALYLKGIVRNSH